MKRKVNQDNRLNRLREILIGKSPGAINKELKSTGRLVEAYQKKADAKINRLTEKIAELKKRYRSLENIQRIQAKEIRSLIDQQAQIKFGKLLEELGKKLSE